MLAIPTLLEFGNLWVRLFSHSHKAKLAWQIVAQLRGILSDPQRLVDLKLELAVTIDVGEHFVKATYYLEGDGPLCFHATRS